MKNDAHTCHSRKCDPGEFRAIEVRALGDAINVRLVLNNHVHLSSLLHIVMSQTCSSDQGTTYILYGLEYSPVCALRRN